MALKTNAMTITNPHIVSLFLAATLNRCLSRCKLNELDAAFILDVIIDIEPSDQLLCTAGQQVD